MLTDEKLKQKKSQRMRKLYIDTTADYIRRNGLADLSVRKIAAELGLNAATTYNYFESFDHLLTFTYLKFLDDYTEDLSRVLSDDLNSLERYVRIFECFSEHSFGNPHIYYGLFYGKYESRIGDIIADYYDIFPEELKVSNPDVKRMLFAGRITDREYIITRKLCDDGFIDDADQEHLVEIAIGLHEYMLGLACRCEDPAAAESYSARYTDALRFFLMKIKKEGSPYVEALGK